MTDDPLPSVDPDDPEFALREARQRFIADFSAKCDVLSGLVRSARTDPDASIGALRHGAHRIAGLAGTVGFPALSAAASDLEAVCNAAAGGNFDAEQADRLVAVMRGAFTEEITNVPSWAAIERRAERAAIKVLVADDDEMQRQLVVQTLRAVGLVPIAVPSGDLVLDTARAEPSTSHCPLRPRPRGRRDESLRAGSRRLHDQAIQSPGASRPPRSPAPLNSELVPSDWTRIRDEQRSLPLLLRG